ncbi:hypothetical protein Ae201684P_007923 [Aphanomyces euteiches]|nr:hypothetical protein Ae201684P_007923 [Aphanomyces euteiches]
MFTPKRPSSRAGLFEETSSRRSANVRIPPPTRISCVLVVFSTRQEEQRHGGEHGIARRATQATQTTTERLMKHSAQGAHAFCPVKVAKCQIFQSQTPSSSPSCAASMHLTRFPSHLTMGW